VNKAIMEKHQVQNIFYCKNGVIKHD
jgi:hypothetical protein